MVELNKYVILGEKFYYLKESEIMRRIIICLSKREISISELSRILKSSKKVTWQSINKLKNMGIIKRKELTKEKHHPVIISLTTKGKKILEDLK